MTPVEHCHNVVERGPRLFLGHVGAAPQLNASLRGAWSRIIFPVPDFPAHRLANTASLVPPDLPIRHKRVPFPRFCDGFLNPCRLYHAEAPILSFVSCQRATEYFLKTYFRPNWTQGSGPTPANNPLRSRWTVARLHPSLSAVSCAIIQSRVSDGGSGRRWRVFLAIAWLASCK